MKKHRGSCAASLRPCSTATP
ncbi:hypothetical protein MED222_05135 [Vibrio sp. MED222]|nr:hypothetical protein MED222_05135 [Vibrio sp. MED222]